MRTYNDPLKKMMPDRKVKMPNRLPFGLQPQLCVMSRIHRIAMPLQQILPVKEAPLGVKRRLYIFKILCKQIWKAVPWHPYWQETAWNLPFSDHLQPQIYVGELVSRWVVMRACRFLSSLLQHPPKLFRSLLTDIEVMLDKGIEIECNSNMVINITRLFNWLPF